MHICKFQYLTSNISNKYPLIIIFTTSRILEPQRLFLQLSDNKKTQTWIAPILGRVIMSHRLRHGRVKKVRIVLFMLAAKLEEDIIIILLPVNKPAMDGFMPITPVMYFSTSGHTNMNSIFIKNV